VFDEVTFGKFVQAYCCTGERFFDIHPPHGKLLIAAA
jgi:dolichyl-phosphate-mannose--protein O-mannosyl transferase